MACDEDIVDFADPYFFTADPIADMCFDQLLNAAGMTLNQS